MLCFCKCQVIFLLSDLTLRKDKRMSVFSLGSLNVLRQYIFCRYYQVYCQPRRIGKRKHMNSLLELLRALALFLLESLIPNLPFYNSFQCKSRWSVMNLNGINSTVLMRALYKTLWTHDWVERQWRVHVQACPFKILLPWFVLLVRRIFSVGIFYQIPIWWRVSGHIFV